MNELTLEAKKTTQGRLIGNIFSLGALQGASYLLPLITMPYLIRVIGFERFGLITFAQAFNYYFVTITDYGFNLTATRDIAIHQDDPKQISRVFSNVIFTKAGLMCLSFLLMLSIILILPGFRDDWAVYCVTFLTVVGNMLFPTWFYQGMQQMKHIAILNITTRSCSVLAIFILVHERSDFLMAALLPSIGCLIAGVFGLLGVRRIKKINLFFPSIIDIHTTLADGWHVFVAQAAATMFGPSNVFILGLFASHETVALYSVAEKTVRAVTYLSIPVSCGIYPHVSELFSKSREAAVVFLRKVLLSGSMVFAFLCFCLFICADIAVKLITGQQNLVVIMLIKIMAIIPLTVFIDNLYGTQTMLNIGLERQFKSAVLLSAVTALMLSLILVPHLEAIGSAIAFTISELLVLVLMVLPVHKKGIYLHRKVK